MVANVEYNQLEPSAPSRRALPTATSTTRRAARRPTRATSTSSCSTCKRTRRRSSRRRARSPSSSTPSMRTARTAFKSPTRLECMMQDYVKTTPPGQKVAWTRYPLWFGYYPAKNDIVSAAKLSARACRRTRRPPPNSQSTRCMRTSLRLLGAAVAPPTRRTFRGVSVDAGPAVVLAAELRAVLHAAPSQAADACGHLGHGALDARRKRRRRRDSMRSSSTARW